jgi:hypothetical protein
MKKATLFITLLLGLLTHWVIAQDYTITTTDGNVIITDNSGNSETLSISENGANIRFENSETTRTYSIDGGATTAFSTPADIALSGKTSITINAQGGNDIINIGAFTSNLPSLTVNGGIGDDAVNFNGDITFAANANLDLDLQNDDATPGADQVSFANNINTDILLQGTGLATIKASKYIIFGRLTGLIPTNSLKTANGNITIEANQQEIANTGDAGVIFNESKIESTGTGIVTVKGKGGDNYEFRNGIFLIGATTIKGGTTGNSVEVIGTGGNNSIGSNIGVLFSSFPSSIATITSNGGNVKVIGNGGGSGITLGTGILLGRSEGFAGKITSGGNGTVTVIGNGSIGVYVQCGSITSGGNGDVTVEGTAYSISSGEGVRVYSNGVDAEITSGGGNVSVTGIGGNSDNGGHGVFVDRFNANTRITAGGNGTITVTGIGGSGTVGANHGVYVRRNLSYITSSSGAITINGTKGGSSSSTDIFTESFANIISTSTTAGITLNGTSSGYSPKMSGVDVTVDASQSLTIASGSKLNIDIDGTTADTEYNQLKIVGKINLNNSGLSFSGSSYTPILDDTFIIVNNDGTDAVIGTFDGLAEGGVIGGFLGSELSATISYVGGDGNDVVLTVVPAIPTIKVTVQDASKTYGDANPTFSVIYSGFEEGDDESILTGTLSITTEATTSSNAGEYDIIASGLSAEGYFVEFVKGTLTIEKAPLTIKVNDSQKLINTTNPTFSVTYIGFVNGDDADDLTGTLTYETEAITSSPAGDYPVSASGLNSNNYEITYEVGTLTINAVSCEPITGLSVSTNTSTFTLSWDVKEGATGYSVKVYYAGTTTIAYSGTTTSNSWSKTNVIATNFTWTVEALTGGICSTGATLSTGENFSIYACQEGFTSASSKGGINSFELSWTSVPNVISYTARIYYANGFLYNTFSTASTIIKESNIPDGNYFWTVTINTTCGASEVYGGTFRVLSCTIMNNLSGLSAIGGNKSFTLYWNQLAGDFTGSYRVNFRIRMKGTSTWTYTGKTGGTSYTRTSVPAGTYEWELQAYLFGAPNSCSGSWKKGNDFVVSSSGAAVRESDEVFETDVLAEGIEVINFGAEEKEIMTETFLDFTVFPNPSRGIVSFNLGSFEGVGKLEIFNLMGQVVYSQEVSAGEQIQNKDFSAQAKGMYIVRLSANGNVQTQKFVIE